MLFFLIVLIRNTADTQPTKARVVFNAGQETVVTGAFNMTELEQFAAMMPDEILPPYRKKRTYINSIMAMHEKERPSPYCKAAFVRVKRGWYVLNPQIKR
jgi:homoserine kinase